MKKLIEFGLAALISLSSAHGDSMHQGVNPQKGTIEYVTPRGGKQLIVIDAIESTPISSSPIHTNLPYLDTVNPSRVTTEGC